VELAGGGDGTNTHTHTNTLAHIEIRIAVMLVVWLAARHRIQPSTHPCRSPARPNKHQRKHADCARLRPDTTALTIYHHLLSRLAIAIAIAALPRLRRAECDLAIRAVQIDALATTAGDLVKAGSVLFSAARSGRHLRRRR
jgi:hypothetical protein